MSASAGLRHKPKEGSDKPETLAERLTHSNPSRVKMNPTTLSGNPSGNPPPIIDPTPIDPIKKSEPTIQELLANMSTMMSKNTEKLDKKLDQSIEKINRSLATQIQSLGQQHEITTHRVVSVENAVDELRNSISPLESKLSALETEFDKVRNTNNTSSNFLSTTGFQPPSNSTTSSNVPSGLTASVMQPERIGDLVPPFTGHRNEIHPEMFLMHLEQYFSSYLLTDEQRIGLFRRRLGNHAQTWFDSLMPSPTTYVELKSLFRQQYWSQSTQRKVRQEIFAPYRHHSPTNIVDHAMKWIAKAKFLYPPIEPYDLVGIIIQHYPSNLSLSIRGRNPKTTHELLTVLTELEESTSLYNSTATPSYESRNFNAPRNRGHHHNSYQPTGRNNNNNNSFQPFPAWNNDCDRNNGYHRVNNPSTRHSQQNSWPASGRNSGPNRNQPRRFNNSNNDNSSLPNSSPQATVHQLNTSGNDEEART